MMKNRYVKKNFLRYCTIFFLSFALLLGGRPALSVLASEGYGVGVDANVAEKTQVEELTYRKYAEQIMSCIKNGSPNSDKVIKTGIILNEEEQQEFTNNYYYTFFLGEVPSICYYKINTEPGKQHWAVSAEKLNICMEQHEAALNELQKIVDSVKELSEQEKVKYFAEYLCSNASYDYTYENKTVYQLLVNKKGFCHVFTEAFFWLCKLSDIECKYVYGTYVPNGGYHAWNEVNFGDGVWHAIDVTLLHRKSDALYLENNTYATKYQKQGEIIY